MLPAGLLSENVGREDFGFLVWIVEMVMTMGEASVLGGREGEKLS